MSAVTYKWGDPVWVDVYVDRFPGIVLVPGEEPTVSWTAGPNQYGSGRLTASQLSPRVVEPAPRTWRLPEERDTIRVTDKFCGTYGRELEITKVSWNTAYPIHAGGGIYDLSAIELVRLHDDPTPAEPISGDHVAGAGKKVEPKFHPLSGGWIPEIGLRVVYIGTEHAHIVGWSGEITGINDRLLDVTMDTDGVEYTTTSQDLCLETEWRRSRVAELQGERSSADHVAGAGKVIEEPSDSVNHPRHYNTHPSGIECIEVARHFGFNIGSVIKYVWRCEEKGAPIEDLKKALWYLNDEIQRREKANG